MSNKKAISVIEYMVLMIIIVGAFLLMRNYIQRGVYNQWARSGQSFAFGRQYDAQKTIECGFDGQSNLWYDRNCFETLRSIPGCQTNSCSQGSQ